MTLGKGARGEGKGDGTAVGAGATVGVIGVAGVALIVQQTGAGMAVPALIAWAQSKFAFEHRGRGMGVWTSAFFLGQAISPIIVGTIAARIGTMQGAFLVSGLAAGVIALGALAIGTLRRKA